MEILKRDYGVVGHFSKNYLNNLDKDFVRELRNRYQILHEQEPFSRPTAVINLLGFCAWKLHERTSAIDLFNEVLEKYDKHNLNALVNLVYISRKLNCQRKMKFYEDQIRVLLSDSDYAMTCIGRYHFDHAATMTIVGEYNTHVEKKGERVLAEFKMAFEKVGDNIDGNECSEWLFGLAFFYLKMDSSYGSESPKYFTEGIKLFYQTTQRSLCRTDNELVRQRHEDRKAKSWVYICNLLTRHENRHQLTLGEVIGDDVMEAHKLVNNAGCLQMLQHFPHDNAAVVQKLGQIYMKKNEMITAFGYLKRALMMHPHIGYVHYLMGKWFCRAFKSNGNEGDLHEAIQSLEVAKGLGCNLFNLYYKLAKAYKDTNENMKALAICSECHERINVIHKPELYQLWREILETIGDPDGVTSIDDLLTRGNVKTKDFGSVYCPEDDTSVRTLVEQLEEKYHIDGYFYEREKQPGEMVCNQWQDMVKKCSKLLVFVSEAFVTKRFLAKHLVADDVIEEKIPMIPVRINRYSGELPLCLRGLTDVVYNPEHPEQFWTEMNKHFRSM